METLVIPFVLKGTTKEDILDQMESNFDGLIKRVEIYPDRYEDIECCKVVINYQKTKKDSGVNYCPSREEWAKSE
jgi:hypothetical protein